MFILIKRLFCTHYYELAKDIVDNKVIHSCWKCKKCGKRIRLGE